MKLTSKGTHPKICEEEKPEFPRVGLLILSVIGKSIGILSILWPDEITSTKTLTFTLY